jgi:hypothetical protein
VVRLLLQVVETLLPRLHDNGMEGQVSEVESPMKMSRILQGNVTWSLVDGQFVMKDDYLDESLLLMLYNFLDGGKGGLLI